MNRAVVLLAVVALCVSTTGCGSCGKCFRKKPVAQPVAQVCQPVCAPACQPACVPACDTCQPGGFGAYSYPVDTTGGEPMVVPSSVIPGPTGGAAR